MSERTVETTSRQNSENGRPGRGRKRYQQGQYRQQPRRYKNFSYYNRWYQIPPIWSYVCWNNSSKPPLRKPPQKEPARPPSPFSGTEEFRLRKIQQTSDMIKKALMMPQDCDNVEQTATETDPETLTSVPVCVTSDSEKISNRKKGPKKVAQYNVEEIQSKIMMHISKLSHGKKKNLICASSSGYDIAIQQIQKQKRLELSKALRDMCSNHTSESTDTINSIIPDIGIDLESLPLEVIQQLSTTLDLNFDKGLDCFDDTVDYTETDPEPKIEIEEHDLSHIKIETNCDEICDDSKQPLVIKGISVWDTVIKEEACCDVDFGISNAATNQEIKLVCADTQTKCVQSQTDSASFACTSTQTDLITSEIVTTNFGKDIDSWDEAVDAMLQIDKEISRLTKLRQSLFLNMRNRNKTSRQRVLHNRKRLLQGSPPTTNAKKIKENGSCESDVDAFSKPLQFDCPSSKILLMKIVEDTLLAATENGNVLFINTSDGTTRSVLSVSQAPITSMCIFTTKEKNHHLVVGSREMQMREFLFSSGLHLRTIDLKGCVQCMETAWDYIFIGTTSGELLRYSFKKSKVEFDETISDESVFVLKATQEGARYVLLVGTRNRAVCVRDAMSGLILRTMEELSPTVYTLLLEKSMVYCGTVSNDILVYSFHDGSLIHRHQTGYHKGITCMKIVGNLLFASSYNGKIYVYNVRTHSSVGIIDGPGGAILSMEVLKNIVVVGTMPVNFKSILIPQFILTQIGELI